jgi:methylglutaconyl-CoA hydratase
MADASREDNLHDARKLALLMETLNSFPAPTVAKVQGAVMGGGVGLVSCCDIVIASERPSLRSPKSSWAWPRQPSAPT